MGKLRAYLPGGLEVALFIVLTGLVGLWGFRFEDIALALIGYVVIVLGLNDTFFSRGVRKGIADIRSNVLGVVLVAIAATLLLIWDFSAESVFFIIVFLTFLIYQWDSRVLAGAALLSLVGCVAFLTFKYDADAEAMAVWAYYFLVMTVVLQIIEYRRHPDRFAEGEEKAGEETPALPPLDLRTIQKSRNAMLQ